MISVIEAQDLIRQHAAPLEAETLSLAAIQGRVLRESVVCAEDLPAFDRSAMDGYAIRADDTDDDFEVVDEIRAGQALDRSLQAGQAIRIFTGARLPGPHLKVIMQEHVEANGGRVRVVKHSSASNIRQRGEDARAGEILLEPAIILDATAAALLASVGKTSVLVSRQPRILHLTTGDEVISPEQTPAEGQIRNSNASLIAGLCREHGVEAIAHFHAGDNLDDLLQIVSKAQAETYDVVLISGGSGQGSYDFSGEVFRHLGATIHFRAVNAPR
jgi:molybdopterin molybdotransferase